MRRRPTSSTAVRLVTWCIALFLVLSGSPVALAEDELVVSTVDVSAFPSVGLDVAAPGGVGELTPAQVTVTEDGVAREVLGITRVGTDSLEVMIVMDRSGSMQGGAMEAAKAAAQLFVDRLPADVPVGLVTFGDTASVVLAPTTDRAVVAWELGAITAGGETALYDAMVAAAGQFTQAAAQRSIVLLSDGGDTASAATLEQAVSAVSGIQVHAIELVSSEASRDALVALSAPNVVVPADDASGVAGAYEQVAASIVDRLRITYRSGVSSGATSAVGISISLGGRVLTGTQALTAPVAPTTAAATSTTASTSTTLPASTAPVEVATVPSSGESSPPSDGPPIWAALAVFVGLFVVVAMILRRSDTEMRARLRPLERTSDAEERPRFGRAIESTEDLLERRGRHQEIQSALDAAGIELTAGDVVLRTAGGAVLVTLLTALLVHPLVGIACAVAVPMVVRGQVRRRANARRRAFVDQLPDVLQIIGSMLKSGYGLMQSLDAVAAEASEPSREWFSRVVLEVRTGRDLVTSLRSLSERVDSVDFAWVVAAIEINREVGGDLAQTLETVAETVRDRGRLRGQIQALTAEGRMSAYLMLSLPPAVALFSSLTNPEFFGVLFEGAGLVILVLAGLLMVLGYVWMRKIIDRVAA